jgi:TolB-like protein
VLNGHLGIAQIPSDEPALEASFKMVEERPKRRLAAIAVADVVGYSRLMGSDEAGTLALLKERRKTVLEPIVRGHEGRIVKVMGDGVLMEFASVVNAVAAAIELQEKMAEANTHLHEDGHILLRIGINLGDIIGEGTDVYGDGVNVAARLEALADPGRICVSSKVRDELRGKSNLVFEDMGEVQLKNIANPVRAFRIVDGVPPASVGRSLSLPDKPSIAVLPFTNMSGDAEQDVFTDGLTEDLITDLSRNSGLFVIARHSTFAYKNKALDVRLIARSLGVRYVLEGSACRAAGRVRINVQLIDAIGGDHRWADRFDRDLEDIFAVQDEVTAKIVEALVGRLTAPPMRVRPKSMEAYDLCVRARKLHDNSPQASREAYLLLQQAITLDPGYAEAHRWLALIHVFRWGLWGEPMEPNQRLAVSAAEKAVSLDPNDANNHWILAHVLAYERRWAESDAVVETARELDPNNADGFTVLSDFSVLSGRPNEAIAHIQTALRLNPHATGWYYWVLGQAQYAARQYDLSVETLRREETYGTGSRRILAASLAQLGRTDEARREAELFMVGNPHFTNSYWAAVQPFRDDATLAHFVDGYRKAGLPD